MLFCDSSLLNILASVTVRRFRACGQICHPCRTFAFVKIADETRNFIDLRWQQRRGREVVLGGQRLCPVTDARHTAQRKQLQSQPSQTTTEYGPIMYM